MSDSAAQSKNRLGLTQAEIDWLRDNYGKDADATALVNQYQMVVSASQDPGARGIFSAMLESFRASRSIGRAA
jgi:hypothetical protein